MHGVNIWRSSLCCRPLCVSIGAPLTFAEERQGCMQQVHCCCIAWWMVSITVQQAGLCDSLWSSGPCLRCPWFDWVGWGCS